MLTISKLMIIKETEIISNLNSQEFNDLISKISSTSFDKKYPFKRKSFTKDIALQSNNQQQEFRKYLDVELNLNLEESGKIKLTFLINSVTKLLIIASLLNLVLISGLIYQTEIFDINSSLFWIPLSLIPFIVSILYIQFINSIAWSINRISKAIKNKKHTTRPQT